MKTVDIKGKDYVLINERIKHFRSSQEYKGYAIISDIISHVNGVILVKASIINDKGVTVATGHAQEKEADGYINKTSYVENCETSAWGRALANLGIGIDASIASAEEVANAITQQNKPASKVAPKPQSKPTSQPKAVTKIDDVLRDQLKKRQGKGGETSEILTILLNPEHKLTDSKKAEVYDQLKACTSIDGVKMLLKAVKVMVNFDNHNAAMKW